jgi:hypothetical protein
MAKYATGKDSYAISDRSGFRYRYKDMRKEWNGLLVGKDEWEPKHPQLGPFRKVTDAEALKEARPDRVEPLDVPVGGGGFPNRGEDTRMIGSVGSVTVVI